MRLVFEHFTDGARRVVVRGREEARRLGHAHVGTEHLLLGLVSDEDGVAGRAFTSLGVPPEVGRARVDRLVGHGSGIEGDLRFTKKAKTVLEMSRREAWALGDRSIASGHLTLGLLRVGDSTGVQVVRGLGIEPHDLGERVRELLSARSPSGASPGRAPIPSLRLTPQSQQMLERSVRGALRLGSARLGGRYPAVRLLQTAERAVRELRSRNGTPALTPAPDVDGSGIAPAACSRCGMTSPACGALFVGNGAVLICEHCVDGLYPG
jgi:ATP-dependent Clp protease ATP-binding subunit ClpC